MIFISYRRSDAASFAARIYDYLIARLGEDSVVMDIDNIPLGVSIVEQLERMLSQADVLLVLIGPRWLTDEDVEKRRKIDDPHDFARLELEIAFKLNRLVIPVLLDNAMMPRISDLPPSIARIALIQAAQVRGGSYFTADMRRLIGFIEGVSAQAAAAAIPVGEPEAVPIPDWQAELRRVYDANIARGNPPYQGVEITTRRAVEWILLVRSWSGSPDETGVNRADLSGAIFVAADLSGLQLYGANLTGARLEACNLANVGFGNVTLDNAKLARANLEKADLSQSRMNQADLESAVLRKANLSAASLTGTLLRFADLREANLSGAKLNDVDLSSTALDGAILTEVDMRSAVLHDADLHGMDLTGSTLIGTDLAGTDLHEAILRDVILERAHLENVDLTGAILDEASLMGAILEGTNLSGASVTGTRLDSVSVLASIIVDSKTNLDDAAWGGVAIRRHADPKTRAQRIALYHDVARQNRRLAVGMRAQGLFADASRYRVNEQRMERRAMLLEGKLGAWQFSWLLDVVAGYGEHPERALRAYGIVVVMFALVYYALTNFPTPWVASASQPLQWYEAAVLSLSSFHGRGFFPQSISLGDPVAVVAAVEAVFGLFIELTFIATFTRRFFGN